VLDGLQFDPVDLIDELAGFAGVDAEPLGTFEGVASAGARQRFLQGRGVGLGAEADLGFVIAVEIADDHRRPPDAHVDVPTEVDPPHELAGLSVVAVELVGVAADADPPGSLPPPGCFTTKSYTPSPSRSPMPTIEMLVTSLFNLIAR
jgi:hypothetical protein